MSLTARYYDVVYGGLIGHPEPPLTASEWRKVLARARLPLATNAGFLGLLACATLGIMLSIGFGGLLGYAGSRMSFRLPIGLLGGLIMVIIIGVVFQFIVMTIFTRRYLPRAIRMAANELEYAAICIDCGYSLGHVHPDENTRCSECGKVIGTAIDNEMLIVQSIKEGATTMIILCLFIANLAGLIAYLIGW